MSTVIRHLLLLFMASLFCNTAHAGYILQFDTSALRSSQATVAFDLVNGASSRTRVAFGPLKVDGVALTQPGQITDTDFYQSILRSVTLGDMLEISFDALFPSSPSPQYLADSFSIFLLGQDNLSLIATNDPVGADSLIQWDVGRSSPLAFYGVLRDTTIPSPVPEPATLILLLPFLAFFLLRGRLKKGLLPLGLLVAGSAAHAAPALNNSTDLGAQVQVSASGLVFNRTTNTFDSNVVITNRSTSALNRPFTVAVPALPANVVLTNATAVSQEGAPFITPQGDTPLMPGASLSVPLKFVNSANAAFRFDLRIVRLTQPVPQLDLLLGPDANGNGVRDDLEPVLISRYANTPQLRLAATRVLAAMRNALGKTDSVESAFNSSLTLNRSLDCMIQQAGLEQGVLENKYLRSQMLNGRERISAWIGRMDLLAGQSIPIGGANPCAN